MPDLANGRRVLVTGGSGFLGRHVVAQLARRGAEVVAPRSAEYDLTVPGAAEAMLADAPTRRRSSTSPPASAASATTRPSRRRCTSTTC